MASRVSGLGAPHFHAVHLQPIPVDVLLRGFRGVLGVYRGL